MVTILPLHRDIDENETEMLEEDEEEIDDDSEVISKLLEADEDSGSDDDFLCSVEATGRRDNRPRRSTRLCSSYGNNDSEGSSPVPDEETSSSSKYVLDNRDINRTSLK